MHHFIFGISITKEPKVSVLEANASYLRKDSVGLGIRDIRDAIPTEGNIFSLDFFVFTQ